MFYFDKKFSTIADICNNSSQLATCIINYYNEYCAGTGGLYYHEKALISTNEELKDLFGEEVAMIVNSVSKINKLELPDNNESSILYLRKILVGLAEDVRVLYIKLADRLHNMRTNLAINPAKQKEKANETMSVLVPIAHRLGINSIKSELENLSLYYLKPDVYNDILEKLNNTVAELDDYLEEMKKSIVELLTEAGITFEIKGRVKSNR